MAGEISHFGNMKFVAVTIDPQTAFRTIKATRGMESTMHTCPPPMAAIDDWLLKNGTVEGSYGHLLLVQKAAAGDKLIKALRPYFESAHLDAREQFHAQIGIDLHPDAGAPGEDACYPNCLPASARRGLFGEVMAGLATEAFTDEFVGGHPWRVPVFLFRYHADVEAYLWALARDPARGREIFGRFGSDFIGLAFDGAGGVERVIAGEAKWRRRLTPGAVETLLLGPWETDEETQERRRSGRGIWFEMNRDPPVPHGLRQLQRLLEECDPEVHAAAILSIDRVIVLANAQSLPRTNLILIVGNGAPGRDSNDVLIPWEEPPEEYAAPHDLQVVEIILSNGEALIDALYPTLWREAH